MASNAGRRFVLSPIAVTGQRFSSFSPYVASINDNGDVAFQATSPDGGSGVYRTNGDSILVIANSASGAFQEICSHPDIDRGGSCCFYAKLKSGRSGVFVAQGDNIIMLADSFGPLGPTMNEQGAVAFRANDDSNAEGVFVWRDGIWKRESAKTIARTGRQFRAFHGLPVICRETSVVFRADLQEGGQGIFIADSATTTPIVETGEEFSHLGLFPGVNHGGDVAFAATLRDGSSGVFVASEGRIEAVARSDSGFESFRGALIDDAGTVVYYATTIGGTLGVFTGPDPARDCLLSIGSPLMDSMIAEFALNPVSINAAGQLAIRIGLIDSRQCIMRADPVNVTHADGGSF